MAVDIVHGQHIFLKLMEAMPVRTTSKEACMELLRELTNVWAVPVGGSPLIESGGDMTNGGAEARISAKVGFPRSNKRLPMRSFTLFLITSSVNPSHVELVVYRASAERWISIVVPPEELCDSWKYSDPPGTLCWHTFHWLPFQGTPVATSDDAVGGQTTCR